jgi:TRAP-type mannitol/chloroaromatic compound transport system permease small subunit
MSIWSGKAFSMLILVMVATLTYEVIMRYAFNAPTIWAHELNTMLFGGYYVMGGAFALYYGSHVNMDLLHRRLSVRTRAIVDVCTSVLFFIFAIVLLWKSFVLAVESVEYLEFSQSMWRPPIYPVKVTVPVATALLLLQGLAKFIRDFNTAVTGKEQDALRREDIR